jgi:hypothetical protein
MRAETGAEYATAAGGCVLSIGGAPGYVQPAVAAPPPLSLLAGCD